MSSNSYYAMTVPGLESTSFREISAKAADASLEKFARGIVLFQTAHPAKELLTLRTTEDVYVALAHLTGLGRGSGVLRVLHSATVHADIARALSVWSQVHHAQSPRTWRVVSQMQGTRDFRRIDAGNAVSDALERALPRAMRRVADDADAEFWLWLSGNEALIGLRLSDATMRHRTYKREHLPASLRPTVAAAIAWLSQPEPNDRVLDPLCGVGTILIERVLMAPVEEAVGGDIRAQAVDMAGRNARSARAAVTWHRWDARTLPLESASMSRIVTNLPFGKQLGSAEANAALYPALADEFNRVLSGDGMLVTLTSDDQRWTQTLQQRGWHINKKVVLVVLGQPATIFVADKQT